MYKPRKNNYLVMNPVRQMPVGIRFFLYGIQGKSETIIFESSKEKICPYR
jgi:hypothetical protein